MKTLKWLLLSLFSWTFAVSYAQQDLVVLNLNESSTVQVWNLDVALENAHSGNYTAFQMDLKLPIGFEWDQNSFSSDMRIAGHTCSASLLGNGDLRVIAYSASNMEILGKSGNLFHLSLKVKENVKSGDYLVKACNIRFSKRDGSEIVFPDAVVSLKYTSNLTEYTVVYLVDQHEYYRQTVLEGQSIPFVEDPVKEGHTFSGWSEIPEFMPAHDIEVTGSFQINSYKVVYTVDGEFYDSQEVVYGEKISLPSSPVKEGHTFSGWSEIPEFMPAHDIEVLAIFEVNIYIITYILDGKEYGFQNVAYGDEIIPLEVENTIEVIFLGWEGLPTTMPAHDLTVYGKTEPTGIESLVDDQMVVVYNVDGKLILNGEWSMVKKTLHHGIYIVNGHLVMIK